MGEKLFNEYEDLLGRTELFRGSPLSVQERRDLFDAFVSVCRWVQIFFLWRPNLPDEGDNHILELAVAGGAEVMVTHNTRDFERGELSFPQIQIQAPTDFVKRGYLWPQ